MDIFNALNPLMAVVASPYEVMAKGWTMRRGEGMGERESSLLGRT